MVLRILSTFSSRVLFCLTVGLLLARPLHAQNEPPAPKNWDLGVWAAGATGEENTNSFAEAQILSAAVFVGKVLTGEVGKGWRRGRFEYGVDVIPLFRQFRPHSVYGGGFEPVILPLEFQSAHATLCPVHRVSRRSFIYQRKSSCRRYFKLQLLCARRRGNANIHRATSVH
jgi:hypothetical protein